VGLGLIGGSLLRALAVAGHSVLGYDADPATRAMAPTAAARAPPRTRWQGARTGRGAAAGAGRLGLAGPPPPPATPPARRAGSGYTGLVTDVTSVKGPVLELVRARPLLAGYVGGHPMAGRETSGFGAADPTLFDGCAWVLCLEPGETDLADWLTLAGVLTALG